VDVLRHVVAPVAAGYAVFVAVVVVAWRRPDTVAEPSRTSKDLIVTFAGGYVCFLVIVVVFHVFLSGDREALASAATGGPTLLVIGVPAFAALSWIASRVRRR
jgi:Family of unknown function (DUF6256)